MSDGEIGEYYAALKEHSKEKKSKNKDNAEQLFKKHFIDYEEKNNGVHWVVTDVEGFIVDYYPTTGKWIYRNEKNKTGRGVFNLLRSMGIDLKEKK